MKSDHAVLYADIYFQQLGTWNSVFKPLDIVFAPSSNETIF